MWQNHNFSRFSLCQFLLFLSKIIIAIWLQKSVIYWQMLKIPKKANMNEYIWNIVSSSQGHSWRNGLKSTLNIQLDKDYEDWEVRIILNKTRSFVKGQIPVRHGRGQSWGMEGGRLIAKPTRIHRFFKVRLRCNATQCHLKIWANRNIDTSLA